MRYAFEKSPSIEDLRNTDKYPEFSDGVFLLPDGQQIEIQKLTIYNDGLVVETRHSTEAGDGFLADLIAIAVSEYKLSAEAANNPRKLYLSELDVTTGEPLDIFNEKVRRFSTLLAQATQREYHNFGFKIATDPGLQGVPVMFAFERKAGAQFSQNRFWTQAPLSTNNHLDLLDSLENILAE